MVTWLVMFQPWYQFCFKLKKVEHCLILLGIVFQKFAALMEKADRPNTIGQMWENHRVHVQLNSIWFLINLKLLRFSLTVCLSGLKVHTSLKAPVGPKRDARPFVFMLRVYLKCGNSSCTDGGKIIKTQSKMLILANNWQHIPGVLITKQSHNQSKLKTGLLLVLE